MHKRRRRMVGGEAWVWISYHLMQLAIVLPIDEPTGGASRDDVFTSHNGYFLLMVSLVTEAA